MKRDFAAVMFIGFLVSFLLASIVNPSTGSASKPGSAVPGSLTDSAAVDTKVKAVVSQSVLQPLPTPCFSGNTPQWEIQVTLAESAGIPATLTEMRTIFFDTNLNRLNSDVVTGSRLASFFKFCGSDGVTIPANGRLCGDICFHLGGRKNGYIVLVFTVQSTLSPQTYCLETDKITLQGPTSPKGADLSVTNLLSTDYGLGSLDDAGQFQLGANCLIDKQLLFLHKLTVTNNGPQTAKNVVLTDTIEPGATFQAVFLERGTYSAPVQGGEGPIICSLGAIPAGTSASVWILLQNSSISENIVSFNVASVTSSTSDPNLDNNVASESVLGVPSIFLVNGGRLAMSTTVPVNNAALGTRLTYTIRVTNVGTDVSGASLAFPIPGGTTFASASIANGFILDQPPIGGTGVLIAFIGPLVSGLFPNMTTTITVTLNLIGGAQSALPDIPRTLLFEGFQLERQILPNCIPLQVPFPGEPHSADDVIKPGSVIISGGGIINLVWGITPPSDSDPTPAPQNFTLGATALNDGTVSENAVSVLRRTDSTAQLTTAPCTLIGYKLYIADTPNVIDPANVWKLLSSDISSTSAPRAPNGAYFALVAVYRCPDGSIKDSQPSPVISAGVPPKITNQPFRDGKNLIVLGEGFVAGAKLLINDQVYAKTIVESSTRLFGKKAGKTIRHNDKIQVRSPDGTVSNAVFY